jgi:hypothetical protein
MPKVLMRATDKMPERAARRMQYRTRMMTAELQGGSEFEVTGRDARYLRKAGWAEDVDMTAPEPPPRRRGRPPKAETAAPKPEPTASDDFETMTVLELRALAEDRGHTLRSGYIPKADLIDLLEGRESSAVAEDEDDGA